MDTHYCLNCHLTIDGLDNYVAHRREHCLRITQGVKPVIPPVQPSTPLVPSAVTVASPSTPVAAVHPPCTQSPTQLSVVVSSPNPAMVVPVTNEGPADAQSTEETNLMLYNPPTVASETTLPGYEGTRGESNEVEGDKGGGGAGGGGGIEDFLSTLELQVREKDKRGVGDDPQEGKIIDDKLKTLNILNDFDFSSDSDDLPSDVDELLDYANEEDYHHNTYRRVSRGGKWGPSGKGKGKHAPGKSGKHAPRTYGGKGSKLRSHARHTGGKSGDAKDHNRAEDSDNEAPEPAKVDEKLECKTCTRTFAGQHSYNRHLKSRFHKQKFNPKSKKKVPVKQEIECPICEKVFNNKYNFARHLASTYHTRRESGNEPMVLDENLQRLLLKQSPIQCHICSFYCNDMAVMLEHMKTEDHVEKCSELNGPLICVRCKFRVYNNDVLLQHLNSPEHVETIKASGRPCVVKEVRCNVPCQICYKEFHSATQLEQHINEYHKQGDSDNPLKRPPKQRGIRYKMPCPYCNKEWDTTFALNLHMKRRHTKEKPFPCKSCGIAFTDAASLRSHEATRKHINQQVVVGLMTSEEAEAAKNTRKIKTEKESGVSSQLRNVCQECDFTTNFYGEMRTHYQAEHPEKLLYCKPCRFETFLVKQFEKHTSTSSHAKRSAAFKGEEEEGDFECETCLGKFASKEKLELHQLVHTTIMSERQLRAANDGDPLVGVHPRFHEFWRTSCLSKNEKITCVECQQVVIGQNMLGHLRKHSESFPFHCPKCTHRFASASSLRRHMQTIHLKIKIHQCQLCDEKFSRRTILLTHLMRVHKDAADVECPHECSECDKRFPLKHMLTAHMVMHSDERPHKCDVDGCGSAYKTKYELEIHHRNHTGERPFVCEFCGYSATGRQKLTRHLRTHTQERNYSCQYCEYKAQNSTHLHRHMRIHIGSKPYKCPYCAHTCNTIENIRKHILQTKRHQGLPCYPCQLCDFGTNFIKDFAQHLIDTHNKKIDPKEILSVVAGVFNKEEDTKDIPEGSCALPVKEKMLSPVKPTTVSSELKRKREISGQKALQDGSALIIQLNKRQKLGSYPEIMVDYEPETSQNTAQPQPTVSQEPEISVQTIHVGKEMTETVTYMNQQPQVIQFDEQMIPVSTAIEMVHYTPQAGEMQPQIYEQGDQQYQMVYTTEAPQQMDIMAAAESTESIVLEHERVETIDSIKRAMEGIQGNDQNLEAIEVDESTLLRLDDGSKVQWMSEDGSVILCNNAQQLYDRFQMVVYDGKIEEGEGAQGAVGEVVVSEGVAGEGEMFMDNVCKQEPPME